MHALGIAQHWIDRSTLSLFYENTVATEFLMSNMPTLDLAHRSLDDPET